MPPSQKQDICANCAFSLRHAAGHLECHFDPPTYLTPSKTANWPEVKDDDWCGKYERP